MTRFFLIAGVLVAGAIAACIVQTAPASQYPGAAPAGTAHPQPPGIVPITDEQGATFQISQGVPGDPAVVGCADGQREGFVDVAASPNVAGCIGEWQGTANLRAPATGRACGDDLGPCMVPADVCAAGWHICGASGSLAEVAAIGVERCEAAGGGKFVAAISHCKTQDGCTYDDPQRGAYQCYANGWCSEAVCCGTDCRFGSCPSGIWADHTHIAQGTDQGCGALQTSRARGIMCCK
jgi:hypothetical protein